jgi:AAA domain
LRAVLHFQQKTREFPLPVCSHRCTSMQMDTAAQPLCCEAQAEASKEGQRALALHKEADALLAQQAKKPMRERLVSGPRVKARAPLSTDPLLNAILAVPAAGEKDPKEVREAAEELMERAREAVLSQAQVVVATCAAAGGPDLEHHKFKVVLIDEATQATEPSTLVPLTKGAECIVLAGDPCQLPPTVRRPKAEKLGLTRCGPRSLRLCWWMLRCGRHAGSLCCMLVSRPWLELAGTNSASACS